MKPVNDQERMQFAMLQVIHKGSPPSLDEVRQLFNLKPEEIDKQFGVIATDPMEGVYVVMVDIKARARVDAALATRALDPAEGFFANPPIEPFGPPEEE